MAILLALTVGPLQELDAGLLIKSQAMQAAAVRAALAGSDASGDHTADPRRIGFGFRGNSYQEAREDCPARDGCLTTGKILANS